MNRFLLLLALLPSLAFADLTTQSVQFATSGEPLFAAARTIEKSLEIKIVLQGVDDQMITGKYMGASGKLFLDDFTSKNKLSWAKQNGTIVIAPQGTHFEESLSPKAKVVATSSFSKVLYDPKSPEKLGLMIFQVHNTWADTKQVGQSSLPGVTQLFSQYVGIPLSRPILGNPAQSSNAPVRVAREGADEPKQTVGSFASLFTKNAPQNTNSAPDNGASSPQNVTFGVRGVYADPRLNAVLVRDKIEFFETYKQIIALLDRPTDMVQMDAMIVDIQKDKALEYGINWNWGKSSVNGATGLNVVLPGGIANKLLANIQASQTNGDSQTLSVPSVVTLNNTEAVFSSTANEYISVSGSYDASLNKVTAETALRITPLIANESNNVAYDERRVKLLINVQDGSFNTPAPGAPPTTTQNQITTQAVVRSGDMLVIGGNVVRRKVNNTSGVPVLSTIPVIGAIFGQNNDTYQDYVRIYVIRTNILGEDSATAREIQSPLPEKVKGLL